MIIKLNNQDKQLAKQLQKVFQASYTIEAKILKAVDFPPLNRTLDQYIKTDTEFFAYWKGNEIAGAIEIKQTKDSIHIQSLVVHPFFFRQGIAGKLLNHVFTHFKTSMFTVETGSANNPAIKLYENYGFIETQQYDTSHGIRKIRLEKIIHTFPRIN